MGLLGFIIILDLYWYIVTREPPRAERWHSRDPSQAFGW